VPSSSGSSSPSRNVDNVHGLLNPEERYLNPSKTLRITKVWNFSKNDKDRNMTM
jgi:hypothetical protein